MGYDSTKKPVQLPAITDPVSVEEAVTKGQISLVIPYIIGIILAPLGTFLLLQFLLLEGYPNLTETIPIWAYVITSFVLAFGGTVYHYYAFALPRWRYWAFSNVINPARLYEQAVMHSLIAGEIDETSSYWKKLTRNWEIKYERQTPEQAKFWKIIYEHYIVPERYRESNSIFKLEPTYEIKYSILPVIVIGAIFLVSVGLIGFISYNFLENPVLDVKAIILTAFILVVIGVLIYEGIKSIKKYQKTKVKPLLIFSHKGIEINDKSTEKLEWREIHRCFMYSESVSMGKSRQIITYLQIEKVTPGIHKFPFIVKLNETNCKPSLLDQYLSYYQNKAIKH